MIFDHPPKLGASNDTPNIAQLFNERVTNFLT